MVNRLESLFFSIGHQARSTDQRRWLSGSRRSERNLDRRTAGLGHLTVDAAGGRSVPLAQIVTLSYTLEPPLTWRRQRLPTVTVQADVVPGIEATTVVKSSALRSRPLQRRARRRDRRQREGADSIL